MQIVADENIPFVRELFGRHGEVRTFPAQRIDAGKVRHADALLVRSVTRVDAALLEGSSVRFVGTATIGTDHVDADWLSAKGIGFASAPGSNADSVAEYVLAALLYLSSTRGAPLAGRTVGIVGVGQIGGRLARRLPSLGCNVLLNDPPRQKEAERRGLSHSFLPLRAVLERADVLTLHVPLVRDGADPTFHLIGAAALERVPEGAWLINTSRGAVVDNAALLRTLERGRPAAAVLDVWEGEPEPNPALMEAITLGTPHIAGYSFDGKLNGTRMVYQAFIRQMGLPDLWTDPEPPGGPARRLQCPEVDGEAWLRSLVRQMYDIEADARRFSALLQEQRERRAALFQNQRRDYPVRRTFSYHQVPARCVPGSLRAAVRDGLGVTLLGEES